MLPLSSLTRRNFIYLFSSLAVSIGCRSSAARSAPPPWSSLRKIKMKGDLKVFWNVQVADYPYNENQAVSKLSKIKAV